MKTRLLGSLQRLLVALLAMLLGAAAAAQERSLKIEDLMTMKSVSGPVVSPEGEWVVYAVRARDMEEDKSNSQLWVVPTEGGEPVPMTATETSAGNPQWSPDGKYLSFTASKGEGAKSQIWTLNRQIGGEAVQLTDTKQGVNDYAWSPDGSRLLLVMTDLSAELLNDDESDDDKARPYVIDRMQFKRDYRGYLDRRRTHIYVYTPGEDAPVQVTNGDYDDTDPVWSPDGSSIAFVSDRSDDPDLNYGTDIFVVNVDDAEYPLTQITSNEGRDYSPVFSPDGKRIAYVTSTGPDIGGSALTPTKYLAITDIGADQREILTPELDRNVSGPSFTEDGRDIYFRLEDSGSNQLARVRASGGDVVREIGGEVSVRDFSMAGGVTVVSLADATSPSELYAFDGALARLTEVSGESLAGIYRATVEKRRFESRDGTEVEAFFVKPIGYEEGQSYPTILWLHGGPASQFNWGYNETAQLFAANGYAVVMPNPRGSTGYGAEFAHGTVAAWGENDYDDVMAAIDHGIEIGLVDPARTGVGGWSYGGILTNYVITQTSRFQAAMSGASLGLVTSNYGHDQYQLMYELEFGLPWENPELWAELSPFNKVESITTPTLWMGGEVDWNVPINNSEQMYIAMKRLGLETQLVVYPDEHHGIRRPSFQQDRFERWINWFDRYLKPAPNDTALTN
ncbi:MAG: S9 family peptidase [Pseudomonadota bacterium]|nr:S9 family peptidase [Pseudomonadota bacterium]